MIDQENLKKAQEWADQAFEMAKYSPTMPERAKAAAEVVKSLPDTVVDGEKLREWRDKHEGNISNNGLIELEALLPAPPTPKTMAEIEWDDEHQGMQALYRAGTGFESVVRMIHPLDWSGEGGIVCVEKSGHVFYPYSSDLTPLPGTRLDLTPEETHFDDLPDEAKQVMEESVEEYKAGKFVDFDTPKPAAPRPEDVPVGEPWQVEAYGKKAIGYRNDPDSRLCWSVVYRDDTAHDWMYDTDVTLIARLVPETTEQDDVTVFDPAYTYRDRQRDVWRYEGGEWWCYRQKYKAFRAGTPPAEFGPYTRIEDTNNE